MVSQMYTDHTRRTALVVQMPLDVVEYLRFVMLLMGPNAWPAGNSMVDLIWGEGGIVSDESARNDARMFDPFDRRYRNYPVFMNYELDLKMPVDMSGVRDSKLYTKGMGAGTVRPHGTMTVVSMSTGCVMPASLAVGLPIKLFVFGAGGGNMDGVTLGSAASASEDDDDELETDSDDSDSGDGPGLHFESRAGQATQRAAKMENKERAKRIIEAKRAAHVKVGFCCCCCCCFSFFPFLFSPYFTGEGKGVRGERLLSNIYSSSASFCALLYPLHTFSTQARDALQEFLRDPATPLSQLLVDGENPVHLMMRLCQKRQSECEALDLYEQAGRCKAVKASLEQLILQAKPLSAVLLEILEALILRKDQANSLDLSFRHLERLRLEFADYDLWIHRKLRNYMECIDLVRYGNGATQNRKMVIPLALRKGVRLTNPDLVRSKHPRVSAINATFNRYGQVHGIRCKYSYSMLKTKGIIRELRLVSGAGMGFGDSPTAGSSAVSGSVTGGGVGGGAASAGGQGRAEGGGSKEETKDTNAGPSADAGEDGDGNNEGGDNGDGDGAAPKRKGLGIIERRVMKKIMGRLVYDFTARAGRFDVITVYNKTFIVNRIQFKTLDLQSKARIGEAAFEPRGTHTSYGTNELLKLVEEMTMQALLL
jgi:hypothetical protein